MTLLQYFVCYITHSFQLWRQNDVSHSNEQCAIDASIDQWHSRLKTCICAEM